jgi:uncharacterized membrane protein
MDLVHHPTVRLNSVLFAGYLMLALLLWLDMPERYPVHMDISGNPNRWAEGPGMWILLVAITAISFGKTHLFQRFLFNDPDSGLINVPHKARFRKLPTARKVPVVRRANRMLGLVNTGMLLIFIAVLFAIYHTAHNPGSWATVVANRSLQGLLVLVLVVPLAEAVALSRMVRRKLREEGLLD